MKKLERHRHDFVGPDGSRSPPSGRWRRDAHRPEAVGVSSRTNTVGIDPLRRELTPFEFSVEAVEVRRGLHLKSAALLWLYRMIEI
jgi:hypothetical protein